MTKTLLKLVKWWKAETPLFARLLQSLSGALAALPAYYEKLPDGFKSAIPNNVLYTIAIVGGFVVLALQFTTKKQV